MLKNNFGIVKIAPNPSKRVFKTNNPQNLSGTIMVWDLSGKLILNKYLEETSSIDLGSYPPALYESRVISSNHEELGSQKLLLE